MELAKKNSPKFYKHYQSVGGTTFSLYWENAGKLSLQLKQQIKKLFIDSFLAQYRADSVMLNLTDQQIKNDLKEYCTKSVEPRFINKSKQYLLCASINKKLSGFIFWEDLGKNKVYIAELVVSQYYWKHGLGRALIGSIFSKKPHTAKIMLITELENYGARSFYTAMDYQPSTYSRRGYSSKNFCSYEKLFSKK